MGVEGGGWGIQRGSPLELFLWAFSRTGLRLFLRGILLGQPGGIPGTVLVFADPPVNM